MSFWGDEDINDNLKIHILKLTELINFLINPEKLEELYQAEGLNPDSEAFLIYLKGALDLNSDVTIFEIEETEDNIIFEKEGIRYIQFFPLDFAVELIEFDLDLTSKGYSNLVIAQRLLEYRQKDA